VPPTPDIPHVTEASPQFTHELPAVAVARLAAIADAQVALAETLTVRARERAASGPAPFTPSARTLQKAARGIAALVFAQVPQLAGDIRSDVAARLEKLNVPANVAESIVLQLTSRNVLSAVDYTPAQQHEAITALLVASGYMDGRL
jgi:hypothetical protein